MIGMDTIGNQSSGLNYLQIVPMTFDERVQMYMSLDKIELARMLAERDRLDDMIRESIEKPATIGTTSDSSASSITYVNPIKI